MTPAERFSVQDKSILITGATGALGSVAARALAEAGARLTLAGGNAAGLAELVETAGIDDAVVVTRRPDTPADAAAMVEAAVARHGRLDGVLVASGMNHVAPITEMAVEDFDKVMDANARGAWLVCQAAGRVLLEQGRGRQRRAGLLGPRLARPPRRLQRLLPVEGGHRPAGQELGGGVGRLTVSG